MIRPKLVRIDDRLIHGQVMTAWSKYLSCKKIIIVDDYVAEDHFMEKVLKMAAPPGITVEVYNVVTAAKKFIEEDADDGENIIILVKYPKTVWDLYEKGFKITSLNIGGMGASQGRKHFYKNISASEEEIKILKDLIRKGVKVSIRIVPDDKEIDVKTLLNEKEEGIK